MAQPIGKRIIETAELLEKHGPCTSRELCPYMPEITRPHTRNLLSRAFCHELATWAHNDKGRRVYAIVEGWRWKLKQAEPEPPELPKLPTPFWLAGQPQFKSVFVGGVNPFHPHN